jgi:hypothetical protein
VVDLIERLERLEGKLVGAAKSSVVPERTAEHRMIAPAPVSVPGTRPDSAPVVAASGDWAGFVDFVGKEQKFLASHLQSAKAIELPPGPLKIGVAERHHLNFLQDGENLAALKDLAKRYFSKDVAVQINGLESERESPAATPSAALSASGERSEIVKEALRIFGGSVRNVRRENG